jgi:CBS domain-containing protein
MRVADLMTTNVVTVTPETPLKDVANLLVEHRIAGVPVCDSGGQVVGVVSESDILWKELRTLPETNGLFERMLESAYGDDKRAKATTAGEAMSSPAITIEPEAPIARAARLLIEYMINRLPVVSENQLVGILARSDLVRAFRRPDEEIEREIREDLLPHLWIDPHSLSITVAGGDVTVAGEVENHSAALSIERSVRRLPGVVSFRSELRWQLDDRSHEVAARADRLTRKIS